MINHFEYICITTNRDAVRRYNLDMKLIETESKHIAHPHLHKNMIDLSAKVGYEYLIIGSHRQNSRTESEIERINNMRNAACKRPARFVICEDGRVWADNTHWTISYILNNKNYRIMDIPSYIVDFRDKTPQIVNINNSVYDSIACIKNAIESAHVIQERIEKGWRPKSIEFKIKNLMEELFG